MDSQVKDILAKINAEPPAATPAERRAAFAKLCALSGEPVAGIESRDLPYPRRDGSQGTLREYRSPQASASAGLLLYFHGGGYVAGDLKTHHSALTQLASKVGSTIVALDYRLGPEHRYPTALHDAEDALDAILTQGLVREFDPHSIFVGGDSAGGNLAAVLSLTRRTSIRGQILLYPTLDALFSAESWRKFPKGFIASEVDARAFNRLYARSEKDFRDPHFSPVYNENLAGLPPASIFLAEFDPARGDGELYARELRAADVLVNLKVFPAAIHGFMTMGAHLPSTHDLMQAIADVVNQPH